MRLTQLQLLVPLIFCATTSVAQSVLVPGTALASWDTESLRAVAQRRVQWIFDAEQFLAADIGQPIVITGFGLEGASDFRTVTYTFPAVNIYLQTAGLDADVQTTSFSASRSAPLAAPHYSGPVDILRSPLSALGRTVVNIQLQTPFVYVGSANADLLIEFEFLGAAPGMPSFVSLDAAPTPAHCRLLYANSTTTDVGTWSDNPARLRLDYQDIAGTAKVRHYGAPCLTRASSFYEWFTASTNDLSGHTIQMQKNAIGGYDVTTVAGGNVVAPVQPGLAMTPFSTRLVQLPFTFDFPGGSTTQVTIDVNGSIVLAGSTSILSGGTNAMIRPTVRLLPALHTMTPDGTINVNNVFAEVDPTNPSVMLITWWNVGVTSGLLGISGRSTYQVALVDNGTQDAVEYRYQVLTTSGSASGFIAQVGFTRGVGALDPGSRDLTAGSFVSEDDKRALTLRASRPMSGSLVSFVVDNVSPAGISIVFLCDASIPETDLGPIGLQGCRGYVQLPEFAALPAFGVTPTAVTTAPVPVDPGLLGHIVFAQAVGVDLTANAFGAVTSNAVALTVGLL